MKFFLVTGTENGTMIMSLVLLIRMQKQQAPILIDIID